MEEGWPEFVVSLHFMMTSVSSRDRLNSTKDFRVLEAAPS